MDTQTKQQAQSHDQALQEELEVRYGPALAQQIADEIKKAEKAAHVPDFMAVKAVSETMELFRDEAQKALQNLKGRRKAANDDVTDMDEKRARQEFEKLFGLYLVAQHNFYEMYRKAMSAHLEEVPAWKRYKKMHQEPEMTTVA